MAALGLAAARTGATGAGAPHGRCQQLSLNACPDVPRLREGDDRPGELVDVPARGDFPLCVAVRRPSEVP